MKSQKDIIIVSIVEDTMEIGSALKSTLDAHESICCDHHYPDATQALAGIPSCKPDIVIMDIGLPDLSGVECMKRLLKLLPDTIFIIFTVFDDDGQLFEALKCGASGYLLKEASHEEIVAAIYEALEGGGPMSPQIARRVIQSFNRLKEYDKLESLTDHQRNILKHIADGLLNKEIADKFGIKEGTVKVQIRTIYKKLQVNNRVEASMLYRKSE